ncbi:hypothetical protein ACFTXM_35790 [Streptomyces sp. NPDC056930]|uniref:hypothetical protein n=1 Tax=Streptomyces sp. NPDC056930 TaxID=3345967 RepID=UPI003624D0E1
MADGRSAADAGIQPSAGPEGRTGRHGTGVPAAPICLLSTGVEQRARSLPPSPPGDRNRHRSGRRSRRDARRPRHDEADRPAASAPSAKRLPDDFSGDGYPDVAVGAPMATVGKAEGAGAVSILLGGPGGLSSARKQVLTWPDRSGINSPADARYGTNLRSADLNGDGYADLVGRLWATTPDGDKGTVLAVNWGSASGLSKNATVLRPVPGDQGDATGDLAVGDVDGDGIADIAVGDVRRGGHVLHGPISRTGRWSRVSSFTVDGTDVLDTSDIAIGDVTGDGVGDLAILGFGPSDPWQQHTYLLTGSRSGFSAPVEIKDADGAGVGGTSMGIADLDKDGHGDIVIGRGDEWSQADTPVKKGGALFVSYGGPKGQSTGRKPVWINQDTEGVSGTAEFHDRMGDNIALGDTDGDGYPDIAVGLPGEKIKGIADAGRVLVLKGGPNGVSGAGSKEFLLLRPYSQPFSRAMRTASARLRAAIFWIAMER